jgi:hypothetical protein
MESTSSVVSFQWLAAKIGYFVQAVAALELQIDDLLGLANSRFDEKFTKGGKYPVQLSEKLAVLPEIARLAKFEGGQLNATQIEDALDFRNVLVHGMVTRVVAHDNGFLFCVTKVSLPEKIPNGQKLNRSTREYQSNLFERLARDIVHFAAYVEGIRRCVFRSGSGWPSYLVGNEGDPLNVKRANIVFEQLASLEYREPRG